jgi:hypothetical protein
MKKESREEAVARLGAWEIKMTDEELLKTYELYKGLQSKSVQDEVRISLLENEINKRKEMTNEN